MTKPASDAASVGPLGRLAGSCFRRRGTVVLLWLAALLIGAGLALGFNGTFTADYSVPGSDSRAAQQLLAKRFPAQSGAQVTVVVHTAAGVAAIRPEVNGLLAELRTVPHVRGTTDPYLTPGAISPDGRTLLAYARLDVASPDDLPVTDGNRMIDIARAHTTGGIQVGLSGPAIESAERGAVGSEGIGLAAAAVILLLTFGTVVAAGLPIAVALTGLGLSRALAAVLINAVAAPAWSTALAAMMGIGIGIDYALLMVTRFREWRAAGLGTEAATIATLDTAGRSVVVAGSTVVLSMLGLFAMGVSYMRGAALVTILGVLVVLAASVTLFPALLGYLGAHVDRWRVPGLRRSDASLVTADGQVNPSRMWLRWSRRVARHRYLALAGGVAVLAGLGAPFLTVTFGFPDAGNGPADRVSRQAYDLTARGFGPGANSPLLLAVELPAGADPARLRAAVIATEGVVSVSAPVLNADGDTAIMTVFGVAGPQDARTHALVDRLRERTLPAATAGTAVVVHVGGVTATSIDSTDYLAQRIPYLIAGVVGLSMILLLAAFRSVAVAIKAAVLNLLSVAAAYGVVALVLQGGWAGRLIGIDEPTPLPPFIPVLMFAILFGLSMDYEVFLVSRMRESWVRTRDNHAAVTGGLAGTARVITAAAAIMIAVFSAFVPSPDVILKVIGVGLAAAILLDATIIRLLLVPAAMHLLGRSNWWLPDRLARILPELHIEGRPEVHLIRRSIETARPLPALSATPAPSPADPAAPSPADQLRGR